jgi:hypothetical protein
MGFLATSILSQSILGDLHNQTDSRVKVMNWRLTDKAIARLLHRR